MSNSLEIHSQTSRQEIWLWLEKIQFHPRDWKKGRLFMPLFNDKFPLHPSFSTLPFVYQSRFFEQGNASGGHYHQEKQEILIPLLWKYKMEFQRVIDWEKMSLDIDESEYAGIYIPTGIAHKITSLSQQWVLLVLATCESNLDDELSYDM